MEELDAQRKSFRRHEGFQYNPESSLDSGRTTVADIYTSVGREMADNPSVQDGKQSVSFKYEAVAGSYA